MHVLVPSEFRDLLSPPPSGVVASFYADHAERVSAVRDAEVLWAVSMTDAQAREVLDEAPCLRWIFTYAAGTDSQPLAAYRERGVTLTNGSGIQAVSISEYVVMAMLAAAKDLPTLVRAQDRAQWVRPGPRGNELFDTRALIIGYGAIGHAIGERLRPFGVEVVGVRRRHAEEPGVLGPADWRPLLGSFDWVILAAMLTAETRGMIGAAELASMRPEAWLLNIARGALVDQDALIAALKESRIAGAYLDVTVPEPLPRESELWHLPNVIITPHSSWTSRRFNERSARLFREQLDRYVRGEQLRNVVNLEVGVRVS